MKALTLTLSAAALLALATSPALSASRHHVRHHAYSGGATTYGYYGRPFNSGGVNSPAPIYRQGHYLGTDPDPNVRSEIARDPYFARR